MPDTSTVFMFTNVLQGLIFWLFVLALVLGLVLAPRYLRSRDRQKTIELMRIALEKGQPLPPELIASLTKEPEPRRAGVGPSSDLRRAIVLMAVGLGIAGFGAGIGYGIGYASPVGGAVVGGIIAGIGAIPGFIGVAFLVLWLATGRNRSAA